MENTFSLKERELIRNLKNNSRKAFDDIYKLYSKRLFAYCLQFTKSPEDTEEIVQDIFIHLWTNRASIRQEETLRSLLFIMAKHRLINSYRSTINSPIYEDYLNYQEQLSTDPSPIHSLEYNEFVQGLKKALRQLPSTQQEVIELSRMEGKTNKEIAEILSLSEQTVKNQLSIGLKALRKDIKKLLISILSLLFVN